jgi:transcriptional regulator with XRE-family HTH domain
MARTARQDEAERTALTVRFLRFLCDWSQRELADAAGVDRKEINRYESGRSVPTRPTLERLCAAAAVPLAEIEPFLPILLRLTRRARRQYPDPTPPGPETVVQAVLRRVEAELPCVLAGLGEIEEGPGRREASPRPVRGDQASSSPGN